MMDTYKTFGEIHTKEVYKAKTQNVEKLPKS